MVAHYAVPAIPMRKSRKPRDAVGQMPYLLRNLVDRCINNLKNANSIRLWIRDYQHDLEEDVYNHPAGSGA